MCLMPGVLWWVSAFTDFNVIEAWAHMLAIQITNSILAFEEVLVWVWFW